MLYTPDKIESLEENQIFVFGSNGNGNHIGGAAKLALDKFGAIEGKARGKQGQSYAIETLDKDMKKVPVAVISRQIKALFTYAKNHTNKEFIVTKIGCGIAGFDEQEVIRSFDPATVPSNVVMPPKWKPLRAYKAFKPGLICRGFQYEIGKVYEFNDRKLELCVYGSHFCFVGYNVYNYYTKEDDVCEVEILGDIVGEGDKSATNKIRIIRKLTEDEKKFNSGDRNSGDRNSGDWNSGDRNSGDWNSGDWNSGDRNSGNRNSGNWNSGNWNSGYRNSGYMNSGDRNSGNWNSGYRNSGYMNSDEPTARLFNKDTGMTFAEVDKLIPDFFYFSYNDWIDLSDMTKEEKKQHPEAETTGGYIARLDHFQAWRKSWDKATKTDRKKVLKLPNWDNTIFKKITGIDAEAELELKS